MNIIIKIKKFVTLSIIMLFWWSNGTAQGSSLDFLRSTGKIYAVTIVIAVIFIGIVVFLFRLDNKLTKLENHIKNEQ